MTIVQYQAAAEADLVGVWLQVADDGGPDRGDEYISKLQAICELVASQPDIGVNRTDIAKGVRSFPLDRYVIYYEQHGPTVIGTARLAHSARS